MLKPIKITLSMLILICNTVTAGDGIDTKQRKFSDLKQDEQLVFFRTSGWLDVKTQNWIVPIHGWVYEPQESQVRKASVAKVLERKYDLKETPATRDNFAQRVNLLLSDNERGKEIVIHVAGEAYVLPESEENGHFKTTLAIPVARIPKSKTSQLYFSAVLAPGDTRRFQGESLLLEPEGISIISDIDDTVKITNVTERKELLRSTFLDDFKAVPGMSELYQGWRSQGASLHFVSSSPWQLHQPLEAFLISNKFPETTMSLKSIRFKDETIFNLFKKGTETKPAAIEAILNSYPRRKFILVGDSGEQDAEVYAQIAEQYSDQIEKIFIRNINADPLLNQRYKTIFAKVSTEKWRTFISASEIRYAI